MGITLNKNSWHFKYYSSVVSETPPRSLCPYFWTMVLLIIVSPFIGGSRLIDWVIKQLINSYSYIKYLFRSKKPTIPTPKKSIDELLEEIHRKIAADSLRAEKWNKVSDWFSKLFKWVFLPVVGIFLIFSISLHVYENGWYSAILFIGIVFLLSLIAFGVVTFIDKYGLVLSSGLSRFFNTINPLKWNFVIVIGEMIKTAYTKACPLITWEGTDKDDVERKSRI